MYAFAYASTWFATSAAVIYGIHVTGSLWPLWTFFLPASVRVRERTKESAE